MIEARVRVISAAGGMAWVSASETSGCSACQSQAHCGISGLGKYLSRRQAAMQLAQPGAKPGDELLLCVEEAELLRASLFAYLVPALLAVIAAALADASGASDLLAAVAALIGFILGLAAARLLAVMPTIESRNIFSPTPRSTS